MLDGIWLPHSANFAGNEIPLHGTRLTIVGDRYTVETPHGTDHGTLVHILQTQPATLDIIGTAGPNAGRTIPAICCREQEQLTICYDVGGGPRPGEFKASQNSTQLLIVYRLSSG